MTDHDLLRLLATSESNRPQVFSQSGGVFLATLETTYTGTGLPSHNALAFGQSVLT